MREYKLVQIPSRWQSYALFEVAPAVGRYRALDLIVIEEGVGNYMIHMDQFSLQWLTYTTFCSAAAET